MIQISSCQVCGSEDLSLHMKTTDFSISKEHFTLNKCQNCGFVFTQNPPSESSIGKYYESEDYISHSNTKKGLINRIYHVVRNLMLAKKYRLIRRLNRSKEILDIGSGTGYFLDYMKGNGYRTLGIEPDDKARNHGIETFGLEILPPSQLMDNSITTQFSFISMWHVLEHLYEPEKYMDRIRQLLKDDGYLIVALPNCSSFDAAHYKSKWAGYDVPRHLWHFTPATFIQFAGNNGFEMVKMKRLPFDAYYVALLSEKYLGSSLGLIKGAVIGFISMLRSWMNVRNTSSVIYVLKKSA